MKKWIAFLLTIALASGLALPASAAEARVIQPPAVTVEVSLSSIEQIMTDYSQELAYYINELRIAREKKEDAENPSEEDAADYQYDLAKKQYEQKVHGAVLNAEQAYLAYCADADRLTGAQTAADSARKALNDAVQALSFGYASQKNVDDLRQQVVQAQNALTLLDSRLTQEKDALRTLLNLPDDVSMRIKPVSAGDLDFSDIPSINYSQDVITMCGNSQKIKAAELTYDYTEDYHWTKYEVDNAEIAIEQVRQSEQAVFKKLYDAMTSSYTVYLQALTQVQQKENELALEQKSLSLGYSSQKAVDARAQELKNLQTALADSRAALFSNYLSYINMKRGYSAVS